MTEQFKHSNLEEYLGDYLFQNFEQQFEVVYAKTSELKQIAYSLRTEVLDNNPQSSAQRSRMGIDAFDCYAHHLLMRDLLTDSYVGTIRLIVPRNSLSPLSVSKEKLENDAYLAKKLKALEAGSYGEIATLAIRPRYQSELRPRERGNDSSDMIVSEGYDFPKITMGLYLAAIALAKQLFFTDVFTAIQPMLFKKLRGYGLFFEHASATFEDHDTKAVYQLSLDRGTQTSRILQGMNDCISRQLSTQLDLYPEISFSDG